MIEFIVAVDPRPDTKARHFVSVAQALGRGLVRPWCHARKRDRFSAHPKPQKFPDRLGLLRHVALPSTHFFPRRAKNLFGFEYLIAPYTIAHLKLSQYLRDQQHPIKANERLQVFLTNTLEPVQPQANFLVPAVNAEVEAAQAIKEQPILVITGNPPYSGHSKNKGPWITAQIAKYREG